MYLFIVIQAFMSMTKNFAKFSITELTLHDIFRCQKLKICDFWAIF